MLFDFYLLAAAFFHDRLQSALTASWSARSFKPCLALCTEILDRCGRDAPHDCLLRQVAGGLPFTPRFWHALAGELIVLGREDMPLIEIAPRTLCCLLAPDCDRPGGGPRRGFVPIEQVLFGTRDLRFGGAFYRPDHAGYNDKTDVERLLAYLEAIEPAGWIEAMLQPISELASIEDRAEELAFVRDWWLPLVEVYRDALRRDCVIVCERR
jgi:hypothetical protein